MRCVGGVAAVDAFVFHVGHAAVELFACDVEGGAEIECIERFDLARDKHDIIGRLVEHHQFAVAVIDYAARRIYRFFQECVGIGRLLVLHFIYLQVEKTHKINQRYQDNETAYYIFPFFEIIVFSHVGLW